MYQPGDYEQNRAQLRARLAAAGIPFFLLLGAAGLAFGLRWPQAVAMALTVAACSLAVFCYCLFISPVIAYGKHIDHALHGRTRDAAGVFVRMEENAVAREGLDYYAMTLNVGDKGLEEDDRLFYYDANLPRPAWQAGQRLVITSYDNRVTAWRADE
ncbi:MAG: hypothetical protein IJS53_04530 [Clostridia bacterium]|nr:hypothetical protein [Clostridia bacterium]